MSAPRFRLHTDGAFAAYFPFRRSGGADWLLCRQQPGRGGDVGEWVSAAVVHGAGWCEAVLVALPKGEITARTCGCGIAPDGAPWAEGCSAECMAPEIVTFDHVVDLDVRDGAVLAGDGETLARDGAERRALALLAAARWGREVPR